MHRPPTTTAAAAADDGLNRQCDIARLDGPLTLADGACLPHVEQAYETYGTLAPGKDNVVLVCHAMTSDQHAAGAQRPGDARAGWWDCAIGPGKMIDTDRFFVICINALGSSGGSTAPASVDPDTGAPYAMRFPIVTVADMVKAQARLLDALGIEAIHAVIGGCMGGFLTLEWARLFPARVARAVVISATPSTSAYTIALWELMRQVIYADPNWRGGDYYGGEPPLTGLGLSAMIGTVLWFDRETLASKFGRRTVGSQIGRHFAPEFAVEDFLASVRANASARFDPNSLIYMTKAVDLFDLAAGFASLESGVAAIRSRMMLVSYASDWRYPAAEIERLAAAMATAGVAVEYRALDSHIGHGAFQFDVSQLAPVVTRFIAPD